MPIILGRGQGGGGGSTAPSGPAGGDLTGTYPNPDIAAGAVDTTELANDAVDSTKIDGADAANILTELGVSAFIQTLLDDASAAAALVTLLATPADGWIDDSANAWTRTSDTTFTVTGDRTAVFTKGTRLKWTQTTVKYGTVIASAHAGGTTTVTIASTTDYVLTAAAISANSYSYAANPAGYPGAFAYTPTWTGFSADPTGAMGFSIVGKLMTCYISPTPGTSNATTLTLTMPAPAASGVFQPVRATNNSADLAGPGMLQFSEASATVTAFRDGTGAAWTASGTKRIAGLWSVEI